MANVVSYSLSPADILRLTCQLIRSTLTTLTFNLKGDDAINQPKFYCLNKKDLKIDDLVPFDPSNKVLSTILISNFSNYAYTQMKSASNRM